MESSSGRTSSLDTVTAEDFLKLLSDSGLMTSDEIQSALKMLPPAQRQDARQVAQHLVKQGKLTNYQVQVISQGRTKGLVLGNYAILEKIGQGGMGMVFKATHRRMGRVVALKVLPPGVSKNTTAVKRFQREVQAAARLSHPNIVAAYDADEASGVYFLVMEYVEGTDLSQRVKKQGPLAPAQAVACILQAASGLAQAHAAGIIHRDIKPSNLIVVSSQWSVASKDKPASSLTTDPCPPGTIKILDMGLARMDAGNTPNAGPDELTQSGSIMGTCDYMAPEQAINTRKADQRADIYSLGCTLYFLLTGKTMYGGETPMEKLMAHQQEPIPPLPGAPPALQAVYQKMVAKKADDRYQTMADVIAALQASEGALTGITAQPRKGTGLKAPPPGLTETHAEVTVSTGARPPERRSRAGMLLAGFVLLALGGGAAFLFGPSLLGKPSPTTQVAALGSSPATEPRETTAKPSEPSTRPVEKPPDTRPAETKPIDKPPPTRSDPPIPSGLVLAPPVRVSFQASIAPSPTEHDGQVTAIAFSPDSAMLATATRAAGAKLWDLRKPQGKPKEMAGAYLSLAFRPDGKGLAGGDNGGAVQLWDPVSGAEVVTLRGGPRLPIYAISFFPENKTVAVAQFNTTSPEVHHWVLGPQQGKAWPAKDLPEGLPVMVLSGEPRRLAWAGKDHNVYIHQAWSGKHLATLKGHTTAIRAVAMSTDGSLVAAGAEDGMVRAWNVSSGKQVASFKPHAKGTLNCLAFTPDGIRLATGAWDGLAHLWELPSGRELAVFKGHRNGVTAIAISPDGKTLATGSRDATVKLWDVPPAGK